MTSLTTLLVGSLPDWVILHDVCEGRIRIEAAPRLLSGAPGDRFNLVVETDYPSGTVRETVCGARLPCTCPERHINYDGSFCLGLDRPAIETEADVERFWNGLRAYLLAQQFAERNKRWPTGRGLSHGEAAYRQLDAEKAAERAGLSAVYNIAIEHREGWLAGDLPTVVEGSCESTHPDFPLPRDDGTIPIDPGCDTCQAVAELIAQEALRRASERNFVEVARKLRPCCHTIPTCPLGDAYAHAE